MPPPRIALVYPCLEAEVDGIRDYSLQLADALRAHGSRVSVIPSVSHAADADVLILQYNPFAYGRWGFAPRLPAELARLRGDPGRPTVILLVHEAYVPLVGFNWTVEGLWQRVQLNAISALADSVYGSIEAITSQLAALRPRRPVTHLPVGSNLPDRRERRAYARETLRLEAGELVIATFGTGHADRLPGHIAAGVNAVAAVAPVTLLNLGANAPEIPQLDTRVRTVHPGAEPLQRVAERLASADLFMCAWRDGVSTKRGSLMAGLQHALPVLGTCGPNTDTLLRDSVDALQLVSVTDRPQFAMAASALAVDPPAREALGRAGRALYELRFSWDVIAARILSDLERGNR